MKNNISIESEKQSMKKNSDSSAASKTGYNEIGNSSKIAAKQGTRNK